MAVDDNTLTATEVKEKLAELRRIGKEEGHLIEEMRGEILALEFVLEERNNL